jgi:hypothetical protein
MAERRRAAACTIGFAALLLTAGSACAAEDIATPPGFSLLRAPKAGQPPGEKCRRVSKLEYQSAKKQFLLVNRFGMYVRTGGFWKRYYWYCH